MPSTALGERLVAAHYNGQAQLRTRTVAELVRLWPGLNPADLEGSWPSWSEAVMALIRQRYAESASLSVRYLNALKAAETGKAMAPQVLAALQDLLTVGLPEGQLLTSLRITGPVAIKRLTASGMAPADAARRALVLHSGSASRLAQLGGRNALDVGVSKDTDAVGYARVTGPSPCKFCAMLAGRGAVYKSGLSAGVSTEMRRYHDHCNCTVEPLYRRAPRTAPVAVPDTNPAPQEGTP